jgi:hypothetical protein
MLPPQEPETMAESVRIEVDSRAQALDLSLALAVRGLNGSVVSDGLRWLVEVRDAREETRRLLADVSEAVVGWLADRGYEYVTVRAGDRVFVLRRGQAQDPVGMGASEAA